MGSGTILRESIAAAELLEKDFGVTADIWSCPSFNELAREAADAERWNRLHPEAKKPRKPYITELLEDRQGPAIVATDYVRTYPEQVRAYVPMRYTVLGTDGFGRSDTRANLRRHFEVSRFHIAHAAVAALAAEGAMTAQGRGQGDRALRGMRRPRKARGSRASPALCAELEVRQAGVVLHRVDGFEQGAHVDAIALHGRGRLEVGGHGCVSGKGGGCAVRGEGTGRNTTLGIGPRADKREKGRDRLIRATAFPLWP
jgi:hypothetical protein